MTVNHPMGGVIEGGSAPLEGGPLVNGGERKPEGRWGAVGLFAGLMAIYCIFLFSRFSPAIVMPDDNGYFAQASLITRSGSTWFTPQSDAQYIGIHWLVTPEGKYVSRYPGGLSVVIGALYEIGGWRAGVLANPLLAVGGLVGVFMLGRLFMPGVFAVGAAAVLALNPTFNGHALAGDAHTGVLFALVWGVYFLVRWSGERKAWLAGAAGLLLGCIPVVRYPDAVMAIGLGGFVVWAVWVAWQEGNRRLVWQVGVMAACAAVPMLPQLVRNQMVLGAFWRTGYSLSNEQTGFGLNYFADNWQLYIRTINSDGAGMMFGLGLAGMAGMLLVPRWRGLGILMVGCVVPMLLLYMAYYWAGMGGNGAGIMRFLLPTFAMYALAGMWAVSRVCERAGTVDGSTSRFAGVVVGVLVAVTALWGLPDVWQSSGRTRVQRGNLARVTEALEKAVPAGSVVLGEPGLLQHLDYVREWKLADPSIYRGGPMVRAMGRDPTAPSPMQVAKADVLREKYPGTMDDRRRKFAADVRTWAGEGKVFVVGSDEELRALGTLGNNATLREVARVPINAVPTELMRRGGGGPGGPGGPGGGGPGGGPGGPGGPMGPGGGGGPGDMPRPDPAPGIPDPFAEAPGATRAGERPMAGGAMGRQGAGNQAQRRPGGGGGGIMSMGTFGGAKEVVIAEWVRGQ